VTVSTKCQGVVAIVANVKQFRRPFYQRLSNALSSDGIKLTVVYSNPSRSEATKSDSITLPPPLGEKAPRLYMFGDRILLQFPRLWTLARADMIIVIQANGYLINYPLLVLSRLRIKKVAFWGHGYNRQGRRRSLLEKWKRRIAVAPYWWFAYTDETKKYLESLGMPATRITTINNSIDTKAFGEAVRRVRERGLDEFRRKLGITGDDRVGLYCGSLYHEKRLPYLLVAADDIFKQLPEFRLIISGAGPEADFVAEAVQSRSYLRYMGALFGTDKASCFALAEVFLNPGLVGLGILDCFAAGIPFVTTSDALHSPEIDYLEPGINGFMITGGPAIFSQQVVKVLCDQRLAADVGREAFLTAQKFTLEGMVNRVRDGIWSCLGNDAIRN
jgi:glycosyltransferase involved in cell wall biosynthesis